MSSLKLTSPAFDFGERMPKKYGYKYGNSSPPLTIDGVPENCQSLAFDNG